jgi:hypothetical protein
VHFNNKPPLLPLTGGVRGAAAFRNIRQNVLDAQFRENILLGWTMDIFAEFRYDRAKRRRERPAHIVVIPRIFGEKISQE